METGHNISIISSSFFQWLQNGSQFYYWPILAWYQVLTYSVHVYARVCVCVWLLAAVYGRILSSRVTLGSEGNGCSS